ncbi:MAG: 50S ribosomal protein L28 [Alphaproteobacteria bacterium]
MSKKCSLTNKGIQSGNNVSHANNRTRRRFLPNLHIVSLFSEALNKVFKLKICSNTLRSIEHKGGFDSYLENTKNEELTVEAQKIKKAVKKANGGTKVASAKPVVKKVSARNAKKAAK